MATTFLETIDQLKGAKLVVGWRYAVNTPTIEDLGAILKHLKTQKHAPDLRLTCRGHSYGWVSFGLEPAEAANKHDEGVRPSGRPKRPLRIKIEAMEPGEQIDVSVTGSSEMAVRVMANQVGKTLNRVYSATANRDMGTITVTRKE